MTVLKILLNHNLIMIKNSHLTFLIGNKQITVKLKTRSDIRTKISILHSLKLNHGYNNHQV
jgi:hypothetical protein